MKVKDLKIKLAKLDDDMDVVIERDHKKTHVRFAKRMNHNKRTSEFTPRFFLLVG